MALIDLMLWKEKMKDENIDELTSNSCKFDFHS